MSEKNLRKLGFTKIEQAAVQTFRVTFDGFAPVTVAAENRGKARIAAERFVREQYDLKKSHSLVKATVESVVTTEVTARKVREEFLPFISIDA